MSVLGIYQHMVEIYESKSFKRLESCIKNQIYFTRVFTPLSICSYIKIQYTLVARYTGKTIYIVFNFLCVKIAWKERKRGLEWPIWKRYKVFITNPYVDTNKLWVDIIPKGDMRPRSTYCNQIQVKAKIAPRHGTWQNFQSSIWPGTCYQGMDCQVFTLPFHRSLLWNFFGGFSTT